MGPRDRVTGPLVRFLRDAIDLDPRGANDCQSSLGSSDAVSTTKPEVWPAVSPYGGQRQLQLLWVGLHTCGDQHSEHRQDIHEEQIFRAFDTLIIRVNECSQLVAVKLIPGISKEVTLPQRKDSSLK